MEEIKIEKDVYDFLYYTCFGASKNIFDMAVDRAYRDVQRTVRWGNNNKKREKMKSSSKEMVKNEVLEILNKKDVTKEDFDSWHEKACKGLVKILRDHGFEFYIGQAQKWINMTFKYLYIIDSSIVENLLPLLHIPIDNYIIEALKNEEGFIEFDTCWSKFDDYEKYSQFQKWFASLGYEYPLKRDFKIWEETAQKINAK